MLAERHAALSVHRLSRQAIAEVPHDATGMALGRLGVTGGRAAHPLERPDGNVAYRGGSDLTGLGTYLATWLDGQG